MDGRTPNLLEQFAGLDFPVSQEDLVRRAQELGADTETLQALRSLPVAQLDNPTELAQALAEATAR